MKPERFIIMNDKYIAGGAEIQSRRELKYFTERGHEILYITFDPELGYLESKEQHHINFSRKKSAAGRMFGRYVCDRILLKKLREQLKKFKPDFIHINNIYYEAPTVFNAIKGFHVVQTVRDFSIVCVKSTCVFSDGTICSGCARHNCMAKCFPKKIREIPVFIGRFIAMKRNEKYRKEAVSCFTAPSNCLTEYCNNHGFRAVCINNPFDFSLLYKKKERITGKKIFLYYGVISKKKGAENLCKAFALFEKNKKDVELQLAGKLDGLTEKQILLSKNIRYLGVLKYSDMMEKLKEVYSVVVPSIWIENYPNTVLEGFAHDCIVIGSNRGGISEQINDRKCLFDATDIKDIIRVLKDVDAADETEYESIINRQRGYLQKHNTPEIYYAKLMGLVRSLKEKDALCRRN